MRTIKLLSAILFTFLFLNSNAQLLNFSLLKDTAGQSMWSPVDTNLIAMGIKGSDGYYDVYFIHPDGSGQTCITCNTPGLPGKHQGTPAFHPSGKYLAITIEKAVHPGTSFDALPGLGGYSDIWVIKSDGSQAWQLTNTPNDSAHGVMLPRFSPDGRKLLWTERTAVGNLLTNPSDLWVIKVADFDTFTVSISNVQTYGSTNPGFYECYGWSPDGSKIIFSSDWNQVWIWANQVFTMDTLGGNVTQITDGSAYCEQASYTPNGNSIIYMTTKDCPNGSDWWIMNADTTNKRRLTFFNDSTSTQYWGFPVYMGLTSFSPNRNRMVSDILQSLTTQVTNVYITDCTSITGIDSPISSQELNTYKIYPDPFSTQSSLQMDKTLKDASLKLYNSIGQLVRSITNINGDKIEINKENLSDGIYFFQLLSEHQIIASGKFTIE